MASPLKIKPIVTKEDREKIHYDAVFGIRVLRNGQFKGLWELVRLDSEGNRVQVLTDANSRGMCMTILNRQLQKIVVQM